MNKKSLSKQNKSVLVKLEAEEARIRNAIVTDAGDFKELQSDWQERDSPAERNLREVEWSQYSGLQHALVEIGDAKQRLAAGTYGVCEDCDEEISAKRLSSVLTARRCFECQEQREKDEGLGNRKVSL